MVVGANMGTVVAIQVVDNIGLHFGSTSWQSQLPSLVHFPHLVALIIGHVWELMTLIPIEW
jgi:hypothetical protein